MALTAGQYFEFASSQQRKIITREGLIICSTTDSVPQDAIFISCKSDITDLEEFVANCFDNKELKLYFIYFQGMRHIQPNLSHELKLVPYIQAETSNEYVLLSKSVRIFRGSISFYQATNLDIKDTTDIYDFDLKFKGKRYELKVIDRPLELGVPEYFHKYEPSN